MADSKGIKGIIIQAAMWAAKEVMMAFRDTETGPQPATTANQQETQRQRHGGPILEKPTFNWDM